MFVTNMFWIQTEPNLPDHRIQYMHGYVICIFISFVEIIFCGRLFFCLGRWQRKRDIQNTKDAYSVFNNIQILCFWNVPYTEIIGDQWSWSSFILTLTELLDFVIDLFISFQRLLVLYVCENLLQPVINRQREIFLSDWFLIWNLWNVCKRVFSGNWE